MKEIGHEESDKGDGGSEQPSVAAPLDFFVIYIVHDIENPQRASQKDYSEAKDQHPWVEQGIETVGGIGPTADDRLEVGDGRLEMNQPVFDDDEIGTFEECGDSPSEQQRTHQTVECEEKLEGAGS